MGQAASRFQSNEVEECSDHGNSEADHDGHATSAAALNNNGSECDLAEIEEIEVIEESPKEQLSTHLIITRWQMGDANVNDRATNERLVLTYLCLFRSGTCH